jgi:5-methylcytosine-specific restriction protein A
MNCPLCKRDVDYFNSHHFLPKSKGGKETTDICIPCHNTIHDLFTNNELRDNYNTPETLLSNERFQSYVKWIKKKPAEFIPCFKKKK